MNLRLMGLCVGAAAMATGACGEEPERQCVVARAISDGSTGSFAATFTLKPDQNPDRVCAQLKPEPVGLQKYFSQDPAAKDTVAVRTSRMGKLVEQFKDRLTTGALSLPYASGALATDVPGADNFCDVPVLTPAVLQVPESSPENPAQSFAYEWSNLRIYNTPEIPGTQFIADLSYTENDCTAQYRVRGIWPVVSCKNSKTGLPDEALCDPYADPAAGRLRGSGINPIFPVKCDPDALICVLTGEVPSDKQP